jgi:hypothetical protein
MFYAPVNTLCLYSKPYFVLNPVFTLLSSRRKNLLTISIDALSLFDDTENNVSYNRKIPANVQHIYNVPCPAFMSCIIFQTPPKICNRLCSKCADLKLFVDFYNSKWI